MVVDSERLRASGSTAAGASTLRYNRHVAEAAQAAGGVCGSVACDVEQDNTTAQQVYESLDMYRTRYQMYEVEFDDSVGSTPTVIPSPLRGRVRVG